MQGVTRRQGLFSLTRDTTRQFARQAPSHRACFARYQRGGCGQIGRSRVCTAWLRSPSYDLRRTRRDLPDLTRNAVHGGINQRFLSQGEVRRTCRPEGRGFKLERKKDKRKVRIQRLRRPFRLIRVQPDFAQHHEAHQHLIIPAAKHGNVERRYRRAH